MCAFHSIRKSANKYVFGSLCFSLLMILSYNKRSYIFLITIQLIWQRLSFLFSLAFACNRNCELVLWLFTQIITVTKPLISIQSSNMVKLWNLWVCVSVLLIKKMSKLFRNTPINPVHLQRQTLFPFINMAPRDVVHLWATWAVCNHR